MNDNRIRHMRKINYLSSETQALYHLASLKLGISDSISIVLYSIYDSGDSCLLSDVYKKSGISKQTVHSAVRNLEADGILFLEQQTGRSKRIVLTKKGRMYIQQTAARLFEAEIKAFDSWTEQEIETYIRLMEKYKACFRQQVELLQNAASEEQS